MLHLTINGGYKSDLESSIKFHVYITKHGEIVKVPSIVDDLRQDHSKKTYYIRNYNYRTIRLKTRLVTTVFDGMVFNEHKFVRNSKNKHLTVIDNSKCFIPASNDTELIKAAEIGTKAAIKAKRLKNVAWIDEIHESKYKLHQIYGISYEDVFNEAYTAILNYSGKNRHKVVEIKKKGEETSKYRLIVATPIMTAIRGANNYLNKLQLTIASNAALDGKETYKPIVDPTESNTDKQIREDATKANLSELGKMLANESAEDVPKVDENCEGTTERRKAHVNGSAPRQIESDVVRREKIEYIMSHLTSEEQKLFKVYSEEIKRTYSRKAGANKLRADSYHTKRVELSVIRERMHYPDEMDRSTIGKKLKAMIVKVANLMKDYDSLSKNMLSFADNTDSGDMIRRKPTKANKAVFNLRELNKVHTEFMESYKNVADNEGYYNTGKNRYIPGPNHSKGVFWEKWQSNILKSKICKVFDKKPVWINENEQIEHITNMFNPLAK